MIFRVWKMGPIVPKMTGKPRRHANESGADVEREALAPVNTGHLDDMTAMANMCRRGFIEEDFARWCWRSLQPDKVHHLYASYDAILQVNRHGRDA